MVFNTLPVVHSIMLRGGLNSPIVRATLPTHLICLSLLAGSFIIYVFQFPERFARFQVQVFPFIIFLHTDFRPTYTALFLDSCPDDSITSEIVIKYGISAQQQQCSTHVSYTSDTSRLLMDSYEHRRNGAIF